MTCSLGKNLPLVSQGHTHIHHAIIYYNKNVSGINVEVKIKVSFAAAILMH